MKTLLPLLYILCLLFSSQAFAGEQWIQRANFGGEARHRCTGFAVGNKGYIGGGHINSGVSVYHEDYWQYDPASDTWTQIADFGGGKRYHSVAFSVGEFGYVGCGEDDADTYHNDFYRYSPIHNIWQPIADLPGNPRRGASSFVIGEFGYAGLGQSDFGYEEDFFKYDPTSNSWVSIADFLGEARSAAVGFSHGGKGYVGTGHIWGDDTKDFFEYTPLTDSWVQKADVGLYFRQDATGFVIGDKGYIATGNDVDGNVNYKDVWEYSFDTDTWVQIENFSGEGRRYMVSFVIGDVAYAGTGTDGTNLRDFYMFNPLLSVHDESSILAQAPFPNPSDNIIRFDFEDQLADIKIYDITGKTVWQKTKCQGIITLDKTSVGAGIYFYQIIQGNQSNSGKIVFE